MTDLFGPDKDFLKANLPVREVARQLTSHHGLAGPYILADGTALCPFHADSNESFYLWDKDDGEENWWCQPCGFGGDIFDLIRRSLGLTWGQAVEEAQLMWSRMPPGYVPPDASQKKRYAPTMDTWITSVTVARNYAAREERQGILSVALGFVKNDLEHAAEAREWDTYLRDTWRWGITPPEGHIDAAGAVRGNLTLLPHYNGKDELIGCKTRSGPQKGSLPGSKYIGLYGEWLGRRYRDVLITEGETDAVYAAYIAAKERIPIDVFALPGGAHKPPLIEHADFLRGAKVIYLCLDPDDAGIAATRVWMDFLAGQGFMDVRVCSLPWGRDLRSARPGLKHLLARAKTPLAVRGDVIELPDKQGWDRVDGQGNQHNISHWMIEPLAKLAGSDPGLDVLLHTRRSSQETTIQWSDMESVRSLNKWANRHDTNFLGSEPDRKAVVEHIEAAASILPQIFQTEQVGAHPAPEEYAFAGESIVYANGYLGKLPWRYTPLSKSAADVSDRVLLPLPEDAIPFEWSWLDSFLNLSDSSVTHPLLAWVVAASRRHTVRNFPLLYIGGSSGVGKSTLARLVMRLGGSAIEVNLGAVTPFVLTKTLAATTNIPVFVDEWTLLSRHDTLEQFQGAIPLLYTGERAERGQADLSMVTFRMTAPTIIAGEQELQLDREIDRMVAVFPSRRSQNPSALASIEHVPLEGFASALHKYTLSPDAKLCALDYAPAASRPIYNQQVLNAGWAILQSFIFTAHLGGEDVPDIPEECDLSCFERVAEDRRGSNIYEDTLATGVSMKDKNGVPLVWLDEAGRGTWVRAESLIGELKSRRIDMRLPGGSRAMLRYFEERYRVHKSLDIRPQGASTYVRAALIEDMHITPQPPEGEMFS